MLADIAVEDIHRFEEELFEHLSAVNSDLLDEIRTTGVLSPELEAGLRSAIAAFKNKFLGKE